MAVGPVDVVQVVTPTTPVIVQLPVAVGATALTGPETVVVNEIVAPREAVGALAVTETDGVAVVTVVVLPEVGATAK